MSMIMTEKSSLETIFLKSLEYEDAHQRAKFLDAACADDARLRAEVELLIQSHTDAGSFLENQTPDLLPTQLPSASSRGSVLAAMKGILGESRCVALRDDGQMEPAQRVTSTEIPITSGHDRYQLQGEIARGGMGAIIKGRDTDLGRDLAVKVLLDTHKDKPDVIQRFVEEAQIGGQLQHPGVAPVYELGQFEDQRPFFTMKLVKGKTLAALLEARQSPADDSAKFLGIFEQVCQTMAYAHSRGVIHRDLKPANIMVGAFGEVQVMDWGLAKVIATGGIADESKALSRKKDVSVIETIRSGGSTNTDAPAVGSQTRVGSVMGTPAYMPPEQAMGDAEKLDERADVFGLGAILCEILTGSPPYVTDDGQQLLRMAMQAELDDCRDRLAESDADQQLIDVAYRCLEKDSTRRFRDAGIVSEAITKHLESVAQRLRQAEMRRKLTYVVAVAVVLLVAGIGVGGFLLQAKETEAAKQLAAAEGKRVQEQQAANEELQQVLYASEIQLAHSLIEAGNVEHATSLLEKYDPQPGETDRRGFEWHFLDRLCNRPKVIGKVDWVPPALDQLNLNRGHVSNDWKRRIGHSIINKDGDSTHHRFVVVDMDSNEELWSHEASYPTSLEPKWTLSRDGNVVAIAGLEFSSDDQLQIQIDCKDLSTGKRFSTTWQTELHQVRPHGFEPDGRIQLSPDGRLLAVRFSTTGPDGPLTNGANDARRLEVWGPAPLFEKRYDESSYVAGSGALQFSHDGSKILSADNHENDADPVFRHASEGRW